jgi:hypothetical protein
MVGPSKTGTTPEARTKRAKTRRVIEPRSHDINHSEGETAMSRLGNYSEPDCRPAQRAHDADIGPLVG